MRKRGIHSLIPHPETPAGVRSTASRRIWIIDARRRDAHGRSSWRYAVTRRYLDCGSSCRTGACRSAAPTICGRPPASRLFVTPDGPEPAICEFNFSPSSEWAAYRFDGYREGMRSCRCSASDPIISRHRGRLVRSARDARRSISLGGQLALRPLRGDRGEGRHQILLGARASAGRARFPPSGLLCARTPGTGRAHEIRHRPPARRPGAAHAAGGQARRPARPSRLGDRGPDPQPRRAGRGGPQRLGDVRAAARRARRPAGQYDGIAGLHRSASTTSRCSASTARCGGRPASRWARSTSCWSTCRTSAAASTPSSRRCSTCSKRRRRTASRSGCSTGPIPPAARSRG